MDFTDAGVLTGPGHFLEVEKMLPLLTASSPDHPSFHVVAPSLPGFGFSEAPKKPGFAGPQFAEVRNPFLSIQQSKLTFRQVMNKLMLSLGYHEYGRCYHPFAGRYVDLTSCLVYQGGDWGHMVCVQLFSFNFFIVGNCSRLRMGSTGF